MIEKTFLLPFTMGGKSHIVVEVDGDVPGKTSCQKFVWKAMSANTLPLHARSAKSLAEWWENFKKNYEDDERETHISQKRIGEIDLTWAEDEGDYSDQLPEFLSSNICKACWLSYQRIRRKRLNFMPRQSSS